MFKTVYWQETNEDEDKQYYLEKVDNDQNDDEEDDEEEEEDDGEVNLNEDEEVKAIVYAVINLTQFYNSVASALSLKKLLVYV
ncbi:MAG: hypothetical protein EZS28_008490 [Streblomastix strix]|uniref:Uncharacterized protein n=1 Tax=Streblomastix strix TaxID=222440 RepID=A0A5J4WNJ9_9EUKA|nr:MAG: hypothetical protein EZS28_008490 [Streblomastix strix]